MDKLKILIIKLSITVYDLETLEKMIVNIQQGNVNGITMFIFYRQALVYLKNCFDLFHRNYENIIGKEVAKGFSSKKKELIKLLKPYSHMRNDIGGHLEDTIIENLLKTNADIKFDDEYKKIAIVWNIKLIERALSFANPHKTYNLSNLKDLREIGKELADAINTSKKLMIEILKHIQKQDLI